MTEQELKPPLLSEEEQRQAMNWCYKLDEREAGDFFVMALNAVAQAQRESDIKWMKEHCYYKVRWELPKLKSVTGEASLEEKAAFVTGVEACKEQMLKEIDGVAFRPCKEIKD